MGLSRRWTLGRPHRKDAVIIDFLPSEACRVDCGRPGAVAGVKPGVVKPSFVGGCVCVGGAADWMQWPRNSLNSRQVELESFLPSDVNC